jgi:hypothetical protein
MANAAAVAAAEAQLAVEQSKLPLFHADPKKDQFTGDQWLERFENARTAGNWNAERTKSYMHNSLRDKALCWFRMLKVVGIDQEDWPAVRVAFMQNYGSQTNNRIVITDFTKMKQMKDESVQEFFTRIGDIAYNYDLKKPNDVIRGNLWAVPDEADDAELLAPFMALNRAVRQRVLERDYAQFAKNDISYLGLQFFVAGLHDDISLEVIKNGTMDLYEAFLVARAYETAVMDKKKNNSNGAIWTNKVNEMDACFDDEENAEIEAIKRKHQQKRMFSANNGSAYQSRSNGNGYNGNNGNNGSNGNNGNGNYANKNNYGNRTNGNQQSGSRKPNPALGKTCHYCKKKNHFQSECYKRKRDNAPPVKVQEMEEQEGGDNVETIFKSKN